MRRAARAAPSWLAFVMPLAVYAISLAPGVALWDTGEMQTVPYILGVAHPTGFPLFVITGWIFSHLVAIGNVAWRLSLMSAVAMAVACRCVFGIVRAQRGSAGAALGAALIFAAGNVAWTRGSRAEVHAFATMFAGLTLLALVRYASEPVAPRLFALIVAFGLGVATHPIGVLLAPAVLLVVIARRRAISLRTAGTALALLAACGGLYLSIPILSAINFAQHRDPTLALGLPPGQPFFDYDHASTWSGFANEVAGHEYDPGSAVGALATPGIWNAVASRYLPATIAEFGVLVCVVALFGFVVRVRGDPLLGVAFVLAAGAALLFVFGFGEADEPRYYLTSYLVIATYAGTGFETLVRGFLQREDVRSAAATLAVCLGFTAPLVFQNEHIVPDQRNDDYARQYVDAVIARTPDDAVLVVYWVYATPIAYAAYVEHRLGHRVLVAQLASVVASEIPRWLCSGRPVYFNGAQYTRFDARLGLDTTVMDADLDFARATLRPAGAKSCERPFGP